ncbi:hypothetical protein INN71_00480 [Nocardioides sp. ChNu-153]|uniref:hypothetical protein n=1 Tax=unclassified Nocardioides TaxID=2615069 RepID=UPI00240680BC|nr:MULTISPECIES: hypothetical protein [unclassified Nocardioides]MDF9714604.1 hypothetical protein [Nocardioides sp. ChNu-99]MDN7119862.1 hypothetical protein [Nocardioides sp. ChNu-153]
MVDGVVGGADAGEQRPGRDPAATPRVPLPDHPDHPGHLDHLDHPGHADHPDHPRPDVHDAHVLEVVVPGTAGGTRVRLARAHPFTATERGLAARLVDGLTDVTLQPAPAAPAVGRGVAPATPARFPTHDVALLAETLERCLDRLDGMVGASTEARLTVVAHTCALAGAVGGWWVGKVDGPALCVVAEGRGAPLPGGGTASGLADAAVDPPRILPLVSLSRVPGLLAALEGGSFAAPLTPSPWLGGAGPDGGEAVGAGGYDDDARQWLVVLLDGGTGAVTPLRVLVTAATHAALGIPLPRRG